MLRDLRFAVRMLAKTPGFTFIAIAALALGIGAATTNFSTINALMLRPFPLMQHQERLVFLAEYFPKVSQQNAGVAYPDFLEWKKQSTTLDGIGASQDTTFILTDGDKPDRYLGAQVSADMFSFLGVEPILGRGFRSEEDKLGAAPVALLGYDLWQRRFGGESSIIGRTVPINGKQVTIVGVMPKDWRWPEIADLWMPLQVDEKEHGRGEFFLNTVGRVKAGVTIAQARAETEAIQARIAQEHPDTNTGISIHLIPLREALVTEFRTLMLLVMGAVIFVHLIACANVANLLLARAATRSKEIGIRLALGARRSQIVRQLLAESLVLGFTGSVGGLLLAVWGVDLMISSIPADIPFLFKFDFDWRMFTFAVGTGLLSSIAFGLFPALQASRPQLVDVLKEGGRGGGSGASGQRTRNALVVAEVALALILLIGAGLMFRSFLTLQHTNIGVDPSSTLTFRVGLPPSQYPDQEVAARFFHQLVPRLEAIPGVESATAISSLPASGNIGMGALILEGEQQPTELQNARLAMVVTTTPGFPKTAKVPLVRGRDFADSDTKQSPRVALIDEEAARIWFPNQDALGHQIAPIEKAGEPPKWATIIGVVKHVIFDRLIAKRQYPAIYFASAQSPNSFMSVMMRTKSDPKTYVNLARSEVLALNKDIPIYKENTMDEIVQRSFWEKRFFGSLFTVFAALALFLASLGLYGVMAYSVRQRTQEIGVRMALGAQAADVLRMIASDGVRLIGGGLVIGFVGSYFLTKLLASSLDGISAHDPLSFTVLPVILFLVGIVACYVPARSAMQLDPMVALRYE